MLDMHCFKISCTNAEYIVCNFGHKTKEIFSSLTIESVDVLKWDVLLPIILNAKICGIKDADHRINTG